MAGRRLVSVVSVVLILGVFAPAAPAQVLYVDDDAALGGDGLSWATAYRYLQDALAVALGDDEIRVAQGTYLPDQDESGIVTPGDREATFQLISGVALVGGYRGCPGGDCSGDPDERDIEAYETILNGDLSGDDGPDFANMEENSCHVITFDGPAGSPTRVDGLTITGGNAYGTGERGGGIYNTSGLQIANCTVRYNKAGKGGGLSCVGASLSNCTFEYNYAEDQGGAIYLDYSISPAFISLEDCTFRGNSAGSGGVLYAFGQPEASVSVSASGCTFVENSASWGGAIAADLRVWINVLNSTFVSNSANVGGVIGTWDSTLRMFRCIVNGNTADRGGALSLETGHYSTDAEIENCLFGGNSAELGGVVYVEGWVYPTWAKMINCTLVDNAATNGSGVAGRMYEPIVPGVKNQIDVVNTILWNGGGEIDVDADTQADVSYSNVQGGWVGDGNINDHPAFVDDLGDDGISGSGDENYRLLGFSPCVDSGDSSVVGENDVDLDWNPRAFDGDGDGQAVVDMGAYEYQGDCNGNGMPDHLDIAGPTSQDCNDNGCPDECELPPMCGWCQDCLEDGVPDECMPGDCNANDILDVCDIYDGRSDDVNGNLVPDECEQGACCDCPPAYGCLEASLTECNASGGSWASEVTCGEITCPSAYPVNNESLDAITVTDGTYIFSTRCATTDGSPYVDCENGTQPVGSDVWYEYTATCAGDLTVSLCSATDYNAVIEVLPDGADSALCPMVGADDTCGELYGPPSLHRAVTAGERYSIRIGGWNGMQGTGELSIACDVPSCVIATPPDSEPDGMDKPRYVSFTVNEAEASQAIRVSASDVPTGFEEYECTQLWVGEPREFCENAGQSFPPAGGCSEAPGLPTTFVAASLQCEPFYTDWIAWGTVHVYGDFVLPNGLYQIQAIAESCDMISESSYSEPLAVATSRWGDLVTDCTTTPCGPPDGLVGVPTDVTAALDKFKNLPGAVKKVRCDLEPGMPDLTVNITDVVQVLDAFRGFDYPFEPDGDPCGG